MRDTSRCTRGGGATLVSSVSAEAAAMERETGMVTRGNFRVRVRGGRESPREEQGVAPAPPGSVVSINTLASGAQLPLARSVITETAQVQVLPEVLEPTNRMISSPLLPLLPPQGYCSLSPP